MLADVQKGIVVIERVWSAALEFIDDRLKLWPQFLRLRMKRINALVARGLLRGHGHLLQSRMVGLDILVLRAMAVFTTKQRIDTVDYQRVQQCGSLSRQ